MHTMYPIIVSISKCKRTAAGMVHAMRARIQSWQAGVFARIERRGAQLRTGGGGAYVTIVATRAVSNVHVHPVNAIQI